MLTRLVRMEGFIAWRRVDRGLPTITLTLTEEANAQLRGDIGVGRIRVRQIIFDRVQLPDGDVVYCERGHKLTEDDLAVPASVDLLAEVKRVADVVSKRVGEHPDDLLLVEIFEELEREAEANAELAGTEIKRLK